MRIGVLSDTHDNLPRIEKAVKLFNQKKAGFVLHAGDFVAPFTIDKLRKLSCEWLGVFGNNDGEKKGLAEKSESRIRKAPLRIRLDGRKITVVHDRLTLDFEKEKADLIIFGHSHKVEIFRLKGRLILNPGECSGWLSGNASVAVVDLQTLEAKIYKV
ncbi:MAG: metallophosphoesterase [Candidatus Omnitrophica bacterium]|nr:metallophosphoesterase [Candidatus Omnitrophota bacterium]